MTDVLIVGNGLAANTLAFQLYQQGLSFRCIGNSSLSNCSHAAAGIWNPMVFKRLTKSWLAEQLIPELLHFYRAAETAMQARFVTERPMLRSFKEKQEQTLWLKKAETDAAPFLDKTIYTNKNERFANCWLNEPYSFVNQCGNLNVSAFIKASTLFFKDYFSEATFQYNDLKITPSGICYQQHQAKRIVFCEGYLVKHNPYFNWIPLVPAKGELLTLQTDQLHLNTVIFNRNGFLFQTEKNSFKIGATYNWQHINDLPSEEGKLELLHKLAAISSVEPIITQHQAGVRPSSKDRRPIMGVHPKHNSVFVFNGLGTKGVMLAPYFSKNFVLFIQGKAALHPEVDVARFYHLYKPHL